MRSNLIRIKPIDGTTHVVNATGAAVVVKGGAWLSHRIHWTAPSGEPYRDSTSEPLVNGRAYFPPDGRFNRFWISVERLPFQPEDIVLQVFDDAAVSVPLAPRYGGFEIRHVHTAAVTALAQAGGEFQCYADAIYLGTDPSSSLLDRKLVMPRGFIAGGIVGSRPFTCTIYARTSLVSASGSAAYATWVVNQVDRTASYSMCFEFGARARVTASPNTTIPLQTAGLPWPALGMDIFIVNDHGLDAGDYQMDLWERVPL